MKGATPINAANAPIAPAKKQEQKQSAQEAYAQQLAAIPEFASFGVCSTGYLRSSNATTVVRFRPETLDAIRTHAALPAMCFFLIFLIILVAFFFSWIASTVSDVARTNPQPVFKSSKPAQLTESETEYVVTCVKHVFNSHLVLQFDITNTLNDQHLENVQVHVR
jgi:hypothetical protein